MNGKPLFFYIGDTLRSTGVFKNLVINTDSEKIKNLARERYQNWVIIIDRPINLVGDNVPMNDIIAHDVKTLGSNNEFMQVHSTSPFLSVQTIVKAVNFYKEKRISGALDSLFSVNVLKTRLYYKNLEPINHDPNTLIRTQDLDVIYEENSNFYLFSGHTFLKANHRIGCKAGIFEMAKNSIESLDIDNMEDWSYAEIFIQNQLI